MTPRYTWLDTPLGRLRLVDHGRGLAGLDFADRLAAPADGWCEDPAPFAEVARQLAAYFAGERRTFDVPLDLKGTPFQREVWQALTEIPFGATERYGALAARLGRPGASRAVGAANGHNPVAILVPCHRVVDANGRLAGYAGGLERKRWLLKHEQRYAPGVMPSSLFQ